MSRGYNPDKNSLHQEEIEYYNNIASDNGKGPVRLRKRKNGKNKEQQFNFDVSKYKMGANCILLDRF
ncbi:MAG: hypothetical protein IJ590_04810 [Rickettsiales bacterium]|nr:hypothetical protein [Rickettsiales bacterium]